jgi:hypothetical protein
MALYDKSDELELAGKLDEALALYLEVPFGVNVVPYVITPNLLTCSDLGSEHHLVTTAERSGPR